MYYQQKASLGAKPSAIPSYYQVELNSGQLPYTYLRDSLKTPQAGHGKNIRLFDNFAFLKIMVISNLLNLFIKLMISYLTI
jgi:hypothetical protein